MKSIVYALNRVMMQCDYDRCTMIMMMTMIMITFISVSLVGFFCGVLLRPFLSNPYGKFKIFGFVQMCLFRIYLAIQSGEKAFLF